MTLRHLLPAVAVIVLGCGDPAAPGGDESSSETSASTSGSTTSTSSISTSSTASSSSSSSTDGSSSETTGSAEPPPRTILMIGDGMGRGQLHTASVYAHGEPDQLFMQSLPVRGEIVTGSRSGLTDSAAAATTMATGRKTSNGRIGMDEHAEPLTTIVEDANARGLATGIVTTAYLPHATPGGFSAHRDSRHDAIGIADDQALLVQPQVMLGGGAAYYLPAGPESHRTDAGLLEPLMDAGYAVARTADELAAVDGTHVVGLFAPEHMDYVVDRTAATTQPTLAEMSLAALEILEGDDDGFLLVIEGARIDMAGHANDIQRSITETLAFDEAIDAVAAWAGERENVTLLVTADHECGGLVPDAAAVKGVIPEVAWRWGEHTNARVDVFASGPGAEIFDGQVRDHTWVHALLRSRVTGEALVEPDRQLAPDGHLADLRHEAVAQAHESSYGPGDNKLDALWLDADETGLAIGIEGLFKLERNTVVVLVDVDFGAATGFDGLAGNLDDHDGRIDDALSNVALTSSSVPGFGADFALAAFGGVEARREDLIADAGLRGLEPPFDLAWLSTGLDFGEGVRIPQGTSGVAAPGEGFEAFVPWSAFFPELRGGVPPGTRVAVVAVLTNDDGTHLSNQSLPPLPAGAVEPGSSAMPLPGVVEFPVDLDEDGIADGDAEPIVH